MFAIIWNEHSTRAAHVNEMNQRLYVLVMYRCEYLRLFRFGAAIRIGPLQTHDIITSVFVKSIAV